MKRVKLIKIIEGFGFALIRHGAKHDGIRIRAAECHSRCRDIGRSTNTWRGTSFGCWKAPKRTRRKKRLGQGPKMRRTIDRDIRL